MMDPSTALRDPAAKAFASVDAVHRITFASRIAGAILERFHRDAGPSTALREPGLLRIGELVEPSINGPFDFAQGAWAKAIALVDADNRITFATRIAGQFLEDFIEVDEQGC